MIINWERWAEECMREHLSGEWGSGGDQQKRAAYFLRHCSSALGAACHAASTKTKGFGDARIITVLQAINLMINHRGTFLFSSTRLGKEASDSFSPPGHTVLAASKCEEEDLDSCKIYSVGLLLSQCCILAIHCSSTCIVKERNHY